jgi:cbb3-type cytochrome oxidase subunit 3
LELGKKFEVKMMKNKSVFRNLELYISLAMFVVAGILTWQIILIKIPDSRVIPLFVLFTILIASIAQLYSSVKRIRFNDVEAIYLGLQEILTIGLLLATYPLYRILGFYATLTIVVVGISLIVFWPLNRRSVLTALLYSALLVILCYLVFKVSLGLITPVGVLI